MTKFHDMFGISAVKRISVAVNTLFYKNIIFPAQTEYSYFSADFRLNTYSCEYS